MASEKFDERNMQIAPCASGARRTVDIWDSAALVSLPQNRKGSWHHLSVLTYQTCLLHSAKMSLGNFLLIKQSYENKLALFMNSSPVWNNMCKIKIKFGKPHLRESSNANHKEKKKEKWKKKETASPIILLKVSSVEVARQAHLPVRPEVERI